MQTISAHSYVKEIDGIKYLALGQDFFKNPQNQNIKLKSKLGVCRTSVNGCMNSKTHQLNQILINTSRFSFNDIASFSNSSTNHNFNVQQIGWGSTALGILGAAAAVAAVAAIVLIVVTAPQATAAYAATTAGRVITAAVGALTACQKLMNSCH